MLIEGVSLPLEARSFSRKKFSLRFTIYAERHHYYWVKTLWASQAKYQIAKVSARKTWAFSAILIKLTLYKVTIFTLHFARNTNHFADTIRPNYSNSCTWMFLKKGIITEKSYIVQLYKVLYGCRLLPFPLNFYRPLVPKQSMCTTPMYWTSIQNVIVHEHHTAYSKQ